VTRIIIANYADSANSPTTDHQPLSIDYRD
jgi:hypothetical protein